jgi:hypothetical protein
MLFNSYYQQVGTRHPRAQRGLLTRPALAQVMAYRAVVDEQMLALMAAMKEKSPTTQQAVAQLVALGLQHEQQHQELMLTDIKHLLSCHPSGLLMRQVGGRGDSVQAYADILGSHLRRASTA